MIEFGKLGRCVVEGCFNGGSMTSDGEVMLLGATDRKLGLLQAAARYIAVPCNPLLTAHERRGDDATGIGPAGQQLQLAQCRHLCAGHAPVAHALVWCSGALAFTVGTAHAQVRSQITQVNPPVDRSLLSASSPLNAGHRRFGAGISHGKAALHRPKHPSAAKSQRQATGRHGG